MPDLIRHPEAPSALYPGFRLGGRNDKSQRDKTKLASPKGEGFQPSPIGTLTVTQLFSFMRYLFVALSKVKRFEGGTFFVMTFLAQVFVRFNDKTRS